MAINNINRKATELILIKIDQKRILYHSNKELEKQINMEIVNKIKMNHKNRKN